MVVGIFNLQCSQKITGRGLVAVGQIQQGVVSVGSFVSLEAKGQRFTFQIKSVEIIDNLVKGETAVGLLFHYQDDNQRKDFESMTLHGQIIEVFNYQEPTVETSEVLGRDQDNVITHRMENKYFHQREIVCHARSI